jgi:glycosyltransferase involved in cell wall biosynthesis
VTSRVVAIVPAYQNAGTVAATARALLDLRDVGEVVVVDDGSTDATAAAARSTNATVLSLLANRGKGGAVAAGLAARPDADVYLLIDADTAATASAASALLPPVLANEADLVIARLPSAGERDGFGMVARGAASAIRWWSGVEASAPLSGQRAVKGPLLRSLRLAARFGLEVAMTVDAAHQGARILEIAAPFDHDHRGRNLAGFVHRGRQGVDVLRAVIGTRRRRRS